ncbi:MAG: SGNH/GDSL hydrolase family protein [Ilumatobacteraceae bacterium]|nr:SGNH/GDSL hydrolase family protein [Ilumatobacteraceae bacterium]
MRRSKVLVGLFLVGLAACSSGGPNSSSGDTLGGVGNIPGNDFSGDGGLATDLVNTIDYPEIDGPVLAEKIKGSRIIIIGDSILAGTASRYGGAMCSKLVPMGWRVAVEAETGQSINFGRKVLKARIYDGWDAAVVFLGTNIVGRISDFRTDLVAIVKSLAPRPTLLLTTSNFRDAQDEVNAVIRSVTAENKSVSLMDWETISATEGVLNKDRIHPSNAGRAVLVEAISRAVGAPRDSSGKCLDSEFVDDSLEPGVIETTTTLMTTETTTTLMTTETTVTDVPSSTTVPSSTSTIKTTTSTSTP